MLLTFSGGAPCPGCNDKISSAFESTGTLDGSSWCLTQDISDLTCCSYIFTAASGPVTVSGWDAGSGCSGPPVTSGNDVHISLQFGAGFYTLIFSAGGVTIFLAEPALVDCMADITVANLFVDCDGDLQSGNGYIGGIATITPDGC